MSNGKEKNIWGRLFKLWAMICKMVMDGTRDPRMIAEALQVLVNQKVYLRRIFEEETLLVGNKEVLMFETIKRGTYFEFFNSIGPGLLNRRCLTESQISKFCSVHRDKLNDCGVIFLEKRVGEFFVTHTGFEKDEGDTVCMYTNRLDRTDVFSYLRVVVPAPEI